VLRTHAAASFPGGYIASLSIPWGTTKGDEDLGGYHLVWPRDLVQCAGALLALGAEPEARDTLRYLIATQHADGHWNQNQWLGGVPYWQGIQLDEAAFPVLRWGAAVWMAVTLPAYVLAVRAIVGERIGIVLALGFPGVLWNLSVGQNGFLTAALIGQKSPQR